MPYLNFRSERSGSGNVSYPRVAVARVRELQRELRQVSETDSSPSDVSFAAVDDDANYCYWDHFANSDTQWASAAFIHFHADEVRLDVMKRIVAEESVNDCRWVTIHKHLQMRTSDELSALRVALLSQTTMPYW